MAADIGNEILDLVDSVSVEYEGPCMESPGEVCNKSFELSYNPAISKVIFMTETNITVSTQAHEILVNKIIFSPG